MEEGWKWISETVWNSTYWLPSGWNKRLNPTTLEIRYAEASDIFYPIPGALFMLLLRHVAERNIFFELGKHRTSPNKLNKFSESIWRACCYIVSFSIGVTTMWDKSWTWDVRECWRNHPHHDITFGVQIYYLFAASLYVSFTISQFSDVRRKDFWEMFIHHITTLILMTFSWMTQTFRIGTLILILHDSGDVFLETAKTFSYINKPRIRDALFFCFVLTWIITRLVLFPSVIIYSINYDAPVLLEMFPLLTLLSYLVNILFFLHIFWTWYIYKMIVRAFQKGSTPDRDSRSSTESSSETEMEHERNAKVRRIRRKTLSVGVNRKNEYSTPPYRKTKKS